MTTGTDDEGRPPDGRRQYKSRRDQIAELAFHAIVTRVDDPGDPDAEGVSLELFIKEHPRGPGYVSDFIYSDPALPVTVCGVLLSSATGLVIGELELFRAQWGYFNDYGEYVGPDGEPRRTRTGTCRPSPIATRLAWSSRGSPAPCLERYPLDASWRGHTTRWRPATGDPKDSRC